MNHDTEQPAGLPRSITLRVFLRLHRLERLLSRPPGDILCILTRRNRTFLEKVRLDHILDDIRQCYYLYPDWAFETLLGLEREAETVAVPEIWRINFIKRLRGVRNRVLERKRFLVQNSPVHADDVSE